MLSFLQSKCYFKVIVWQYSCVPEYTTPVQDALLEDYVSRDNAEIIYDYFFYYQKVDPVSTRD